METRYDVSRKINRSWFAPKTPTTDIGLHHNKHYVENWVIINNQGRDGNYISFMSCKQLSWVDLLYDFAQSFSKADLLMSSRMLSFGDNANYSRVIVIAL